MQRVSEAVTHHFPAGTKLTRPTGGMCLWVELPSQLSALTLYERALTERISIAPGPLFSAKQKFENCIRLNCSNPWSDTIEKAIATLGRILRDMQDAEARRHAA
jgi:DNA-binding transcriptional MocR family regulator